MGKRGTIGEVVKAVMWGVIPPIQPYDIQEKLNSQNALCIGISYREQ